MSNVGLESIESLAHDNLSGATPNVAYWLANTDSLTVAAPGSVAYNPTDNPVLYVLVSANIAAVTLADGSFVGQTTTMIFDQGAVGGTVAVPTGTSPIAWAGDTDPAMSSGGGNLIDVLVVIWTGLVWAEVSRAIGDLSD